MAVCREIHAGYVKCDIDGDGYNMINVCGCDYEDNRYNYTRISKCYGEVRMEGVSAEEVLDLLEQDRFMIATIDAHRSYNRLVKDLKLTIRPPKQRPKVASNPPVTTETFRTTITQMNNLGNAAALSSATIGTFLSDWERLATVQAAGFRMQEGRLA